MNTVSDIKSVLTVQCTVLNGRVGQYHKKTNFIFFYFGPKIPFEEPFKVSFFKKVHTVKK